MGKKTVTLLTSFLLASLAATQASANGWLSANAINVEVVSDYGQHMPQYPVRDDHNVYRAYLEAQRGQEYGIRVRNQTGQRIGLVIAVDGRNIISGEHSKLRRNERMYILGPHEQAVYRGWRTGRDRVNRFYFTEAGDSYSAAWGDYSAMGVIAVAAYQEKYRQPPPQTYRQDQHSRSQGKSQKRHAPGASESAPGTGYGNDAWSPSVKVPFKAERRSFAQVFLKYEWRETLCRRGVIQCRPQYSDQQPNRLWRDDDYGYARDPYRNRRQNR